MMSAEVNGYTENSRYVAAAALGKQDYLASVAEPVFLSIVEAISIHKPAFGAVQPFVIAFLKGDPTLAPRGKAAPVRSETEEYFQKSVDPFMSLLVRAVATAEPSDVKAFITDLCSKHPDLESSSVPHAHSGESKDVSPTAVAVSGVEESKKEESSGKPPLPKSWKSGGGHVSFDAPPPLRNGMRLGTHHVLVSLRHETDGSAVFTAHCPRTLRDAHVTVPADDPTLSSLIVKHGTGVIYHCDQFLILTEDASGAFQLRWQGRYRPTSTPAGVSGVNIGRRYIQLSLREEGDDVIISAYCIRTHNENYVRIKASDPLLAELKASYGPENVARNLHRHLVVTDGSKGVFTLEWK